MSLEPSGKGPILLLLLAGILLAALVTPSAASFGNEPVLLERTGDEGDAWAIAVRSHDEATSSKGNEVQVFVWANSPFERSIAAVGIVELAPDEDGNLSNSGGAAGAIFRGEDRVHVRPVGEMSDPTPVSPLDDSPLGDGEKALGGLGERRYMEPGEWRYFVVWAAGSQTSTFQVRGEGVTVEKIVEGEGHGFGNDELVNGGGVHAHQSLALPPGSSHGDDGYLGAGVTATSGTGASVETDAPMLGVFTEFHRWDACIGGCKRVGGAIDDAASLAQDGGLADIAMETPGEGYVQNDAGIYWLLPTSDDEVVHEGETTGTYRFLVGRLTDASGPWYQDPVAGQGARLDGEQLVVSVGEVNYTKLEGLET